MQRYNLRIKMQKIVLIFLLVFSITLIARDSSTQEPLAESLQIADSLFNQKHYTESLKIYESILKEGTSSSPQMLLKMAYVYEGLNNIDQALYYLNLYYERTLSRKVLVKMEELAEKNELEGYQLSDVQYFLAIYQKYHLYILGGIFAIALLLCLHIVYKQFFKKQKALSSAMALGLVVGFIFYLNNLGEIPTSAITHSHDTYIMAEPSSGSKLIGVIGKGHKVTIYGQKDVWYKIKWGDQDAFIRETDLLHI